MPKTGPSFCPMCKKNPQSEERGVFPFCSARCKELDLGKWARGDYRVPGENVDETRGEDSLLDDSRQDED